MSSESPPAFDEPEVREEEIRRALNVIALDMVRPVLGGLALVYIVVAIGHAVLLPADSRVPLLISVIVLLAVLVGLRSVLGRIKLPPYWGNRLLALSIVLISLFSMIRLAVVPEIPNAISQPLLVVGAACFLLSRNWLLFIVFWVNGGWVLTALAVDAAVPWRTDLTPLLGGAMLAILIHAVRYRFIRQMEVIRLKDEFIRQEMEAAKLAADEARETAEAASKAKTNFLARMSHELRTPLNAIIGYSEMLQEEAEEIREEGMTEDLQKIRAAGRHLLDLINEVLDLSKIEAGRMDLYLETFQVRNLVDDAINSVEPQLERNGNEIALRFDPEIRAMHADVTKVRQCLINLLSNATKFTKNGTISLEVLHEDLPGRDWIVFEVTDSGIGISSENLKKIFEPFSQADSSTTRKYGGTGLGLVISQRFCAMMGGSLEVESEAGRGSTFRMRLPAEVQAEPGSTTSQQASWTSSSASRRRRHRQPVEPKGTVQLIDDDPAVQELVEWTLSRHGFEVIVSSEGEEGLKKVKEKEPSAILLDVKLPGMDGWEVLRRLKQDAYTRGIPVVVVSILDERARSLEMGAIEFISKPVDRDLLVATIKGACRIQ